MEDTKGAEKGDGSQSAAADAVPLREVGLFLELGRQGPTEIRQLKQGQGPLVDEIKTAIGHWREELQFDGAVQVVPVVILYHRDPRN